MTSAGALQVPERAFQAGVLELAGRLGWLAAHIGDSRRQVRDRRSGQYRLVGDRQAAGFPDLVLVRERLVIAELKTDRGRLTDEQRNWLDALTVAGVEAYEWRPSLWPEIEETLTRRRPPM